MPRTTNHLIAIRHAPTQTEGVCIGDGEAPTTMDADTAAKAMLDRIASEPVDAVWTSPIARCLAPARIVAAARRIPMRMDQRLREIHLGAWQGRTFAAIERDDPARYQTWLTHWRTMAPPDGESPTDLLARVSAWWDGLPAGRHVLVAHAGVIRALRVHVGGLSWEDAMSAPVPHLIAEAFPSVAGI